MLKVKKGNEKKSSHHVLSSPKKKKKDEPVEKDDPAPVSDENEEDEYEVELIIDKRVVNGGTEYLVKWKGWENDGDQTWEPQENLNGSEKLIKQFEVGSKTYKTKLKKQSAEDGVVLCINCNRIFLSLEALRNHEKVEHKKQALTPNIKKVAKQVSDEEFEKDVDVKKSAKRKRSISGDTANLNCYNCGVECKSRSDLKNHVLSHFYPDFYSLLPASKPFTCPTCSLESRDRISLVRHFAFSHKVTCFITWKNIYGIYLINISGNLQVLYTRAADQLSF